MSRWLRLLVVWLVAVATMNAWALDCGYEWMMSNGTWTSSKSAAANSFMGAYSKTANNCGPGNPFTLYNHHATSYGTATDNQYKAVYAYCNDSNVFSTEHNETLSMRPRVCGPEDSVCFPTKDQTVTKNITGGWNRTDNNNLYFDFKEDGTPAPPGYMGGSSPGDLMCINGCSYTLGGVQAAWGSKQPTNEGMYRQSYDYEMTGKGTECTPAPKDNLASNQDSPPPACDGFKGYINGRLSCVAKQGDSGVSSPSPKRTETMGNPAAASQPSDPNRVTATNGDGGNKGGPPHPKDGTVITPNGTEVSGTSTGSPTGNTPKPAEGEEQQACGAPGQPRCKIDETGTPGPVAADGSMGGAGNQLETFKSDANSKILDLQQTVKRPDWTWTFQLPDGCSPFVMQAFNLSIDVCEWKPMFHDLMSFVWGVIGVFAALGMLSRAMTNGA